MVLKEIHAGGRRGELYFIGDLFKKGPYAPIETCTGKLERLFASSPIDPTNEILHLRDEMLRDFTKHFYNNCKAYRDFVWGAKILEDTDLSDLSQLPGLYADNLKKYRNVQKTIV